MQQQTQLKIDIENNNQRDQSFPLDVAHYLRRTLRFRVPTVQPQEVIDLILSNEVFLALQCYIINYSRIFFFTEYM